MPYCFIIEISFPSSMHFKSLLFANNNFQFKGNVTMYDNYVYNNTCTWVYMIVLYIVEGLHQVSWCTLQGPTPFLPIPNKSSHHHRHQIPPQPPPLVLSPHKIPNLSQLSTQLPLNHLSLLSRLNVLHRLSLISYLNKLFFLPLQQLLYWNLKLLMNKSKLIRNMNNSPQLYLLLLSHSLNYHNLTVLQRSKVHNFLPLCSLSWINHHQSQCKLKINLYQTLPPLQQMLKNLRPSQ